MDGYHFKMDLEVRDYECDIQGIVNNSVYLNYFEHCRHKFLRSLNMSFAKMHEDGIDPVVTRSEVKYKYSLVPEDSFSIYLKMRKKGNIRIVFDQEIIRKSDEKLMVQAEIDIVLTKNRKPIVSTALEEEFRKAGIEL